MSCQLVSLEKVNFNKVEILKKLTVKKSPVITEQDIIDFFDNLAKELEKLQNDNIAIMNNDESNLVETINHNNEILNNEINKNLIQITSQSNQIQSLGDSVGIIKRKYVYQYTWTDKGYSWVVPEGVTKIRFRAHGAGGYRGNAKQSFFYINKWGRYGGLGASVQATVKCKKGDVFVFFVGRSGYTYGERSHGLAEGGFMKYMDGTGEGGVGGFGTGVRGVGGGASSILKRTQGNRYELIMCAGGGGGGGDGEDEVNTYGGNAGGYSNGAGDNGVNNGAQGGYEGYGGQGWNRGGQNGDGKSMSPILYFDNDKQEFISKLNLGHGGNAIYGYIGSCGGGGYGGGGGALAYKGSGGGGSYFVTNSENGEIRTRSTNWMKEDGLSTKYGDMMQGGAISFRLIYD